MVELYRQDAVARRAVRGVEEAQELAGVRRGEVRGRGDDQGEAVVAQPVVAGHDGEDEARREGPRHRRRRRRGRRVQEAQRSGVEGVGFRLVRGVGEREEPAGRHDGEAV